MRSIPTSAALMALLSLAACQFQDADGAPGVSPEGFTEIGADERVEFVGTEPFWGGSVANGQLIYSTPENIEGATIAVRRFNGQGGLGFSGRLDGAQFDMMVTQGECSDGMSDRTYPFTVTLQIGSDMRNGCAWSESRPFEGRPSP